MSIEIYLPAVPVAVALFVFIAVALFLRVIFFLRRLLLP